MKQSTRLLQFGILAGVAAAIASISPARAADSATQDVDVTVQEVNEISLGAAVTLTVSSATAGVSPTGVTSSTYSITTNSATSKKITANLATAPAAGLTLSANLQAPTTGSSAGVTALSITPTDVVTSIEAVAATGLTINYAASAAVTVAPNTYSAEVTYTIVDD